MIWWKIMDHPRMQNIFMLHKVFYCGKYSNKQNAKVNCRFDRLGTAQQEIKTIL